jgi:hypothetical protein
VEREECPGKRCTGADPGHLRELKVGLELAVRLIRVQASIRANQQACVPNPLVLDVDVRDGGTRRDLSGLEPPT